MNKRPVVASPPWMPAEDEKLRALVALGERPATIAEQLQRGEEAVRRPSNGRSATAGRTDC
jgi:hypothetical protein